MSVVIFFTVRGDTRELLAGYDRTVAVPHPARLGHLMAPVEEGMMGIEVWTDREDLDHYLSEDLPGIFARADVLDLIPPNVSFEISPVHHAEGRLAAD